MLEKTKVGELEVETNCPFLGLMVDPKDYHDVGEGLKRWECEERTDPDGVSCELCMMSAMVALLGDLREGMVSLIQEMRRFVGGQGGLHIPTIQTRKR